MKVFVRLQYINFLLGFLLTAAGKYKWMKPEYRGIIYLSVCLSVGVCNYEWWRRSSQAKTSEDAMCSMQETLCQEVKS